MVMSWDDLGGDPQPNEPASRQPVPEIVTPAMIRGTLNYWPRLTPEQKCGFLILLTQQPNTELSIRYSDVETGKLCEITSTVDSVFTQDRSEMNFSRVGCYRNYVISVENSRGIVCIELDSILSISLAEDKLG